MRLWPGLAALPAVFLCGASPVLPVEHITVLKLGPSNGHRLYVLDWSVAHGIDGKIHVMDGDTLGILGQFSNGSFGDFLVAKDGSTLFNATTYFSRGDHGPHSEVLEFYDPATLTPTSELVLPPKRAQSNGASALMQQSAKGSYLLIQNATPATSVTVVDLASRKLLAEIPTAGCYGVYPSPNVDGRFSSLCGDGAAITVTFGPDGHEISRTRSGTLFDPDGDALFLPAVQAGAKTVFLSFLGNVHIVDFTGDVATQDAPWSLLTGTPDSAGWRPGGAQLMAYAQGTGMLYVAMHPHGVEGGHKDPGREIWKVDFAAHKVVARGKADGVTSLAVSSDAKPVLWGGTADANTIVRYDADTLHKQAETSAHLLEGGGPIFVQ